MYFFTHLFISKVLYQHFSEEVALDQRAFSYGNIKPDLPSSKHIHHTLENCLYTVCDYSNQLMDDDIPLIDFSTRLGEICHYVSDFFCYYHLNEELHNKKLHHFLYEIRLHISLFQIANKKKYELLPSKQEPGKNIALIILEARKEYLSQPHGTKRDMEYAFMANVWICESIIYFNKYSSNLVKEMNQVLNALLLAEGGEL
jgi:hypothetical protein